MTVEIELKFIAAPQAVAALPQWLAARPHQHSAPQKLTNIYFETADNVLRRHDMGLRIRGFDDRYEMTIKTAGKVVGGLHQRPEYNVAIAEPQLALAQFLPTSGRRIAISRRCSRRCSRCSVPISCERSGWLLTAKARSRLVWTKARCVPVTSAKP